MVRIVLCFALRKRIVGNWPVNGKCQDGESSTSGSNSGAYAAFVVIPIVALVALAIYLKGKRDGAKVVAGHSCACDSLLRLQAAKAAQSASLPATSTAAGSEMARIDDLLRDAPPPPSAFAVT